MIFTIYNFHTSRAHWLHIFSALGEHYMFSRRVTWDTYFFRAWRGKIMIVTHVLRCLYTA